jgi:hypothetical protein
MRHELLMGHELLKVRIEGLTPTVMHNGHLADPTNEWTRAIKAITSKTAKKRTDADYEELIRLEWYGGLYVDENGAPCWPGENIESMIKYGARTQAKGKETEKGLLCVDNWPLEFDGPKTADELWDMDPAFRITKTARVGKSTVMRTRPIFPDWQLYFELQWNQDYFSREQLEHWLEVAGLDIGLSDWRPKYGRFRVLDISA